MSIYRITGIMSKMETDKGVFYQIARESKPVNYRPITMPEFIRFGKAMDKMLEEAARKPIKSTKQKAEALKFYGNI